MKILWCLGIFILLAVALGAAMMGIDDAVDQSQQNALTARVYEAEIRAQAALERQQAFYAFLAHAQSVGFVQIMVVLVAGVGVSGLVMVLYAVAKRPTAAESVPMVLMVIDQFRQWRNEDRDRYGEGRYSKLYKTEDM